MDKRPVGIFDSGFGGLTALEALQRRFPNESIIFFGDNARVPYGTREIRQIKQFTQQDLEQLAFLDVKAVIAACGTVSSAAADVLASFPLPVVGILDGTEEMIRTVSDSGPIGLIATPATVNCGALTERIRAVHPAAEVISIACPDLVAFVEQGKNSPEDAELMQTLENYLAPLKERKVRSVLLGCTHFGFLTDAIGSYLGQDVRLLSASEGAVIRMGRYLTECCALAEGNAKTEYYTSGSAAEFDAKASLLLGQKVEGSIHISLTEA